MAQKFRKLLEKHKTKERDRRWLFVPYDQLSDQIGPLASDDPESLGIILIENPWKAGRRPYHKQKLALILANMRHFAVEQAQRGVAIRYEVAEGPYSQVLAELAEELGDLEVMRPAERELRVDLQPLVEKNKLKFLDHEGWLSTPDQFQRSQKKQPWRMDAFYRLVRQESGILMEDDRPVGGKYSFDAENRESWDGEPAAPSRLQFPRDAIKREVCDLVASEFSQHPGEIELDYLPATKDDAQALWQWAKKECMKNFGPFEDAMSTKTTGLFHTRISALMNLHRLLPREVIQDVIELEIPLSSKEGFIRQVLGWREFVRHVHEQTDGFRDLPDERFAVADSPGDGGYAGWAGKKWKSSRRYKRLDGGVKADRLQNDLELPAVFWGKKSNLACLDRVVSDVWEEGYSHHITRLMVLANLATLLDVSARDMTDWFWIAYIDAYDWVVEPNVLGMGMFAVGELMSTKPYVSGAAYINRMSNYCESCRFNPNKDCPITHLYWAFLKRHQKVLQNNPRMSLVYASLKKRSRQKQQHDKKVFQLVRKHLAAGEELEPEMF